MLEKFPCLGAVKYRETVLKEHPDHEIAQYMRSKGYLEEYPPTMRMNKSDGESAYLSAFKFCAPVNPRVNWKSWRRAWDAVAVKTIRYCGNSRVMTFDEIKNTVDWSKTNGWPECVRWSSKREWLEYDGLEELDALFSSDNNSPYSLPPRDVVRIIAAYADSYPNVDRLKMIYEVDLPAGKFVPFNLVLLKKETRKHEKVDANQVRVITPVSTPHVMMSKMLHEDRMQKRTRAGLRAGTALGHNPFGGGTQVLFNYLCDPDQGFTQGYEADVKAQDSTVQTRDSIELLTINFHCLRTEDRTYENWLRMKNLRDGIYTGPMIMPDGTVLLKGNDGRGGNTSGQHLTTEDNDLKVDFDYLYAYDRLKNPQSEPWDLLEDYERHIRNVHLSDDGVVVPDEDHRELFSFSQVACVLWHELGVVIEGPTPLYRPVMDLQFLAMKFIYDPEFNMVFHSLDPNRVTSSIVQGGSDNPLTGRNTPHGFLLRLAGLLVAGWGNPKIRNMIRDCIQYHLHKYKDYDSLDRRTPWEQAKRAVHDDLRLAKLYTGYEASASPVSSQLDKFSVEQSLDPQLANTISKAVKNSIGKQVGEAFETATEHIVPHIERAAKSVGSTKAGKYLLGKFESTIDYVSGVKPSHKRAKKRFQQLQAAHQRKKNHEAILAQMPKSKKGKSKKSSKGRRSKKSSKRSKKGSRKSVKKAVSRAMAAAGVSRGAKGPKTPRARYSIKSKHKGGKRGMIVVSGTEWIGTGMNVSSSAPLQNGTASAKGTLLYTAAVNPNFGPIRLRAQAQFYEKYRFTHLSFHLRPTQTTSTPGSCAAAWDLDVSDAIGQSTAAYLALSSQPGFKGGCVYYDDGKQKVWSMPKGRLGGTSDGGYYTNLTQNSDPRLVNQAVFNMMVEDPSSVSTGAMFELSVSYVCQLWAPTTETVTTSGSGWSIYLTSTQIIVWNNILGSGGSQSPWTLNAANTTNYTVDPFWGNSGVNPVVACYNSAYDSITFPSSWPGFILFWLISGNTGTGFPTFNITSSTNVTFVVPPAPRDPQRSYMNYDQGSTNASDPGGGFRGYGYVVGYQSVGGSSMVLYMSAAAASTITASASSAHMFAIPIAFPGVNAAMQSRDAVEILKLMQRYGLQEKLDVHKLMEMKLSKMEGKPFKPVKDEDSKYPDEEEEESESSEEEEDPADRKAVDKIVTRPGSVLGLKPALKWRKCHQCEQPAEVDAYGNPHMCRRRDVVAVRAKRMQEEGGKGQPAPNVPMAVSAGTSSQTANGNVQQETNLTLGNQGNDCQSGGLQDQKRLLGTTCGTDDGPAARPQIPDERDRPLRAEESTDIPRRQPIGPKTVGVSKGAGSLDDGDYVFLKWLKQRVVGAGEKVHADVVEEAEAESSAAPATART